MINCMRPLTSSPGRRARRSRCRGSEIVEFSLIFLPMLSLITVLMCSAWAIYAKSTLQRAVSIGVRRGVTLTASDMASGRCLTETVKDIVQQNALGMLGGAGKDKIKVHYFEPPVSSSTSAPVDVSTQASGNAPKNIMQVSVENYQLLALVPRIFLRGGVDKSPLSLTVSSADIIEPSRSLACIGVAP